MEEETLESPCGPLNELKELVEAAGLEGVDSQDAYGYETYIFRDASGELHECWPAVTNGRVNVVFALTPEQAVKATLGHEDICVYMDELMAENAELRELCKAALTCAEYGSCNECRVTFGGCTLRTTMRKLGIEVNE